MGLRKVLATAAVMAAIGAGAHAQALNQVLVSKQSASNSTSLIAKASLGYYLDFYCQSSAAGRCILYNSATVPAAGALTAANVLDCAPVVAGGVGGAQYNDIPRAASSGIVVLFSSATDCNTYTVSATAYIHASVQ